MHENLVGACLIATLCGAVTGLRTLSAPTTVSWAAHLGWLDLGGTWLAVLDLGWSRWVLLALALGELVGDKLPSTASRTVPIQFAARLAAGAVSGAAVGLSAGRVDGALSVAALAGGAACGIGGAVVGTLVGSAFRARLASAFGRDLPAALVEDVVAIAGALLILLALSRSGFGAG